MSDMQINKLLADMRALAAQAGMRPEASPEASPEGPTDFGALLKASIDQVNSSQQNASTLAQSFETGAPNADLGEVMVALQKADISFKAMTEVRNRLVNAYQEIMNMPV
jgi:flagellar hook-basal body complex protein FliE